MYTIDAYKNLDNIKLREICECVNFVDVLSNNVKDEMLNDYIKVFTEVKRNNLAFILDFISIYITQFFLKYILTENLRNSTVKNLKIKFKFK